MKHMTKHTNLKNQNGNVLWFILLAVALMGFLSAVLSRGSSSTNQTGDVERARIIASSLLQYSKSVENAVQNMLLQGISENDLDFVDIDATYDNPNCTERACEIFDAQGGGIPLRSTADVISDTNFTNDWIVSTGNRIGGMGCDDADHSCRDLLLMVSGVSDTLCKQINAINDIENPSNAPPQQQHVEEGDPFTGSFSSNTNNRILGGTNASNESPQVANKTVGCVTKFNGTATNYFYQVLIAR